MRKALRTIFVVAILVVTTAALSGSFAIAASTKNSKNSGTTANDPSGSYNGGKGSTQGNGNCSFAWWC